VLSHKQNIPFTRRNADKGKHVRPYSRKML